MLPRLLILEDDDGVRTSLGLAMEDAGYHVSAVAEATEALRAVERTRFHAMLVDLMLGGMDGFSFISRVRPLSDAPIIVVSARSDIDDIVAALEAGADDYVSKPFVVREVEARLTALLRRPTLLLSGPDRGADEDVVIDSCRDLRLRPRAGTLRCGDHEIHLTTTEFRLLDVLASRPGTVLSRTALLEKVWDRGFFGDERIVDVHVRRLRQKIEREASRPELLITVRGLGYRLDPR